MDAEARAAREYLREWFEEPGRPLMGPEVDALSKVIRAAVLAERERCAGILDDHGCECCYEIAAAIRREP